MRGKFITLEGPEGSGKSTQAKLLIDWLKKTHGIHAIYTREPGGTALGEAIRDLLQHNAAGEAPCERAELLLFEASRNQLVEKIIKPNLAAGIWVICDRFIDSTVAYQGFARGLPVDEVKAINEFTIAGTLPDLTLLLDLPVETGFARIAKRYAAAGESADRFEREARSFHENVRAGYLQLAAENPARIRIIDTAQEIQDTSAEIINTINDVFFKQSV